jgi:hypothetical protein
MADRKPAKKSTKAAKTKKAPAVKSASPEAAEGVVEDGVEVAAKPAKKPKKARVAAPVEPVPTIVMHGGVRTMHLNDAGRDAIEALLPLVDEVAAMGRVVVASVVSDAGFSQINLELPDHAETLAGMPGIVLTVDEAEGLVSFDHVVIGRTGAKLVDAAGFAILNAVRADAENPANGVGRRADWFDRASDAADRVGIAMAA